MKDPVLVRRGDPDYPTGLCDLEDAPDLHLIGKLEPKLPHVGVVGTRNCTRYGIDIAEAMGVEIAKAGWVAVSGLARGIDAAVHRGTIEGNGPGVGVLGCGIERMYPRENLPIARGLINAGGGIISEYAGHTPPEPWRFPRRNRIIAALSDAVVVVESRATGGSQITAVLAAEIGRPVFAVPGDIDRETSVGTNMLIRDGAIPIFGPDDLVAAVSLLSAFPTSAHRGGSTE